MAPMTDSDKEEQRLENIRTEYGAISAKLNQLPSFRFALAGFYLAAVGVIASRAKPAGVHFILLIGLTLVLWLIDLRTRALLANISNRGKQIETRDWGYAGWITGMKERDPETGRGSSGTSSYPLA